MSDQPTTTQDPIRAVPAPAPPEVEPELDLHDPALYDNRELSWVEFNQRVLELAEQPDLPLLERLKFAAIFASNLDEFFMIRVAGLHDQVDAGLSDRGADGLRPTEVIDEISRRVRELVDRQTRCVERELRPALAEHDICIVAHDAVSAGGARAPGRALPPPDLPRAHAAGRRARPAVPLHLQPVAVARRCSCATRSRARRRSRA